MKLPRIFTTLAAACALAISTFILTGCQNTAADNKWIAERAEQLKGKKNPDTGKLYTPAEATSAAENENAFAKKSATGIVYGPGLDVYTAGFGGDGTLTSAKLLSVPTPASMTANPSPGITAAPMGHCFVAGTPVRTPSGAREIQDIRVGDSVLSFNERSGKVEPAPVTKVITGNRSDLMVLTSPHGSVTCSQNHRFLTAESRWTMASMLSASDKVMALGTDFTGVIPVKCAARHKDLDSPVTVHNFEVEGNHDYFVGPDAILCHNSK